MEEACMKENTDIQLVNKGKKKSLNQLVSTPREPLKSYSMTTSTPRQPLMDIKQLARPVDNLPVKSMTPHRTPKPYHTQKTLKPSSLLKKTDTENTTAPDVKRGDETEFITGRMDEIFEENVEEFVTKVLDQCVQDLTDQNQLSMENEELYSKLVDEGQSSALREELVTEEVVEFDEITEENTSQNCENKENIASRKHVVERHEIVSQFGDMSLNEDSLLGDSHYDDCNESFAESSKSEEELLASYVQTPYLPHVSTARIVPTSELEPVMTDGNRVETPQSTFLEKVAVLQRVRNATSNLASWVFPKETTHLPHYPAEQSVKIVHDVACSPIPHKHNGAAISQDVSDDKSNNEMCLSGSTKGIDIIDLENDNGEVNDSDNEIKNERTNKDGISIMIENKGTLADSERKAEVAENTADSVVEVQIKAPEDITQPEQVLGCEGSRSPTKRLVSDCSVQTNVGTHTVMCSPVRFENHDVSIQHEVETNSMISSPIQFSKHDVSSQNVIETHSVMCSPLHMPSLDVSIQNCVDTHSMMCSPIPTPVCDVSVQNEIYTQSVMCSPMVPFPSEDKSVLVAGPELAETGVMTDVREYSDVGVHVQPDTQTVYTEMEEGLMVTTHTSMTPLKLDKKQNRKLTAEDVRKQHPRVLANELETLRLQNSRLEGQVHHFEKDRKKLIVQEELQVKLDETMATVQHLESTHSQEKETWQSKIDKLEIKIRELQQEHEKQMCEVRLEYETNDYKEHFLSSQRLVLELQAELDEYSTVLEDIETAHNIQIELETAVRKGFEGIQEKTEWIKQQHIDIQTKRDDLETKLHVYHSDVKTLEQDKSAVQKERDQMSEIVHSCKENVLQMDCQMQKATAELGGTKEIVLVMREEIDNLMKDKEEYKSHNDVLVQQNDTLQTKVNEMETTISELNSTIQQQEDNLNSLKTSVTEASNKYQSETTSYKAEQEKRGLLIKNLERTLENREGEIDQLERDLFECREIIYTQMENAKASEKREKKLNTELTGLKEDCNKLKDCCANLRAKEQEARATLRSTQEELTSTQEVASKIIAKQGTEIIECSSAIGELIGQMTNILTNLNRRAGIVVKEVDSEVKKCSDKSSKNTRKSLVSQILHAAHTHTDTDQNSVNNVSTSSEGEKGTDGILPGTVHPLAGEQTIVNSPGTVSRKQLGFSGNSAFAPIHSSGLVQNQSGQTEESDKISSTGEAASNSNHSLSNSSINNGLRNSIVQRVTSKFEALCSVPEKELTSQMSKVSDMFTEVARVAYLIEKALRSSLNDITFEKEDMSSRASQCEYSERKLQAELQVTQSELEKTQLTVEQLNDKLQEMGEKFESMLDQELEYKRGQEEMNRQRVRYQAVEAENEVLNEQITELLEKLEVMSGSDSQQRSHLDVNSQREILSLKKKVDKYRSMLNERDTMVEEISAKAASRIQKLETNWKKADEEVCRFDELVDTVRVVLTGNTTAMADTQLVELIELIDGRESLSSFKHAHTKQTSKKAELKPIKTAKW